jgi:hypothetical protein
MMETDAINWADIIIKLLAASGVAAWLSAWLNSKDTNSALQFVKDLLNAIGGNIWKAKNADDDRS